MVNMFMAVNKVKNVYVYQNAENIFKLCCNIHRIWEKCFD